MKLIPLTDAPEIGQAVYVYELEYPPIWEKQGYSYFLRQRYVPGKITDITLSGYHWSYNLLEVTKLDGTVTFTEVREVYVEIDDAS